MPTVGERLATLERRADENAQGIASILELINGGANVEWEQSIRGKLHAMRDTQATADALANAMREVRRQNSRKWATWKQLVLIACAVVTAGCAIVAALVAVL
jgi:t-SNARE complex subunit (syntaxin)